MRQVIIGEYREYVDAARAYAKTPEHKADMRLWPDAERVLAGLVRYEGARNARRRGLAKADYQVKMSATSYNLKGWVRRVLAAHPVRGRRRPAG